MKKRKKEDKLKRKGEGKPDDVADDGVETGDTPQEGAPGAPPADPAV